MAGLHRTMVLFHQLEYLPPQSSHLPHSMDQEHQEDQGDLENLGGQENPQTQFHLDYHEDLEDLSDLGNHSNHPFREDRMGQGDLLHPYFLDFHLHLVDP